jgi:hypothetical protein
MITKLLRLSFVIVALGLLFAPYGAAAQAGADSAAQPGSDYFVPAPLEPRLSSDGKTLYYAGPPVVYVADPNPSHERVHIPPPIDLSTAPESATATFSITYVPNGGTDAWDEPCYTFPPEAQAAFSAAASIWASIIQSPVPITIRACWANLGSSTTLGYSGGQPNHMNFTNAPLANTWYDGSLANALAGSDLTPGSGLDAFDMHITYNENFTWYYGTDGNPPAGQYDLVTVVLHEIAHGLNFHGSMSYSSGSGSWGWGTSYPYCYDTFMKDGSGTSLLNTTVYPNPSTALGTALTSGNLWFHGSNAMAANGGQRVKIYAPATWSSGSSYSHLDYNTFNDTVNELMVYAVSDAEAVHDPGPVTEGLLKDLGWRMGGVPVRILHKDGAIYNNATSAWTTTAPPYYPGTNYAIRLKNKVDGSYTILHRDGAFWNSITGWVTTAPPYYPGLNWAKDLEFKPPTQTVMLDEHFEGTFPPTGWLVKDYTHPTLTYVWQKSLATGRTNYTGGTGYCADADSDKYGSGVTNMNTDLWTPPLNLVGATSATLTFRTAYYDIGAADYASVDVTTNNGGSWTNLLYWDASHSPSGPGELVTLDLTPFCGMNNVIVAFNYYAPAWDWYWEVDDVKVVKGGAPTTTILHKDGALWNSATGWTLTAPPYYPNLAWAVDLEYRSNGSYVILHKDGAVCNYTSGWSWTTSAPPYYPGLNWAVALKFKPGETNYVILHRDGALWNSDTGWVLTSPPYHPGTDYARSLELMGSRYIIMHKDGALYDSQTGWVVTHPPYYPGLNWAVDMEGQ